ncbi:hypothetical protein [Janthinobacterium aquaticum]|uniref:hypothetical protein n=1 Tax=Janthinobacterium sp. FT58W TaxID=2654254 RepID=UPI0012644542|nr:hypothetical protein [Janthinobacterium sp. FT58W]KAB8044983.1 hypothetical protein GCM43_00630 [Janthinobacterium sp. FT58W]
MSIPKKGSRRITVDALSYRWSVSQPALTAALTESNMSFAVEAELGGRTTLRVKTDMAYPDIWLGNRSPAITPSIVERAIRQALSQGWQPCQSGSAVEITICLAQA